MIVEGTKITEEIISNKIYEFLAEINEANAFKILDEKQKKEIYQLITLLDKASIRNRNQIISSANDLIFGDEQLMDEDTILEKLIDDSNVSKPHDKPLLDFSKVGYSNVTQDYLLEYISPGNKELVENYSKEINSYTTGGFFHYANLLRGNYALIEKAYKDNTRKNQRIQNIADKYILLIPEIVESIINLQKLMIEMPERKYDIIINRIEGANSGLPIRSESCGFLSFSSSNCPDIVPGRGLKNDYYKMILPKKMMCLCLPIEYTFDEDIFNAGFECEVLMPYFSYNVLSLKDDGENRKITIGNPKVKDIRQLLLTKLRELQNYEDNNPTCPQKLKEDIKEGIRIVEESLKIYNINTDNNVLESQGRE